MTNTALKNISTTLLTGLAVIIALLLNLTAALPLRAATPLSEAVITRTLPAAISPGHSFMVRLDFVAPADGFNAIGVSDFAPFGWLVETDNSWNTPPADSQNTCDNRADYIWNGPYNQGTSFEAVYKVTAPDDAAPGTYFFTNSLPTPRLEYYVAGTGPFKSAIEGLDQINVRDLPEISAVNPADNATQVAVNTAVAAVFSKDLDITSLTTGTFQLLNSNLPMNGSVTYAETTRTLTFTPAVNLAYSTAYTAVINHAVSDLEGNHLFADFSWSFTTINDVLAVSTTSLPPGDIQTAYSKSLAARGGTPPYTWSKTGPLPPGLTLVGNTISGTPSGSLTSAKEYPFTIQVKDQTGATATQKLSITINPALAISTTALNAAYTGVSYSQTLTAKGGSGNYSWSLQSGTLPAGLTLDSHGALKGLPEKAGTFNLFFSVDDGIGLTSTAKALTLYVYDPLVVGTTTLPDAEIKAAYSATLTASGGCAPYSWAKDGLWPSGLSISKSGVISGKPTVKITAPTTFTFSVKVTDSASKVKTAVSNLLATDAASDQLEIGADSAANDQTDLLGALKIPNNSTLKTFTITIYPELTMTLAATDKALTALLPADNQSAYACPLAAAGGLAPYLWSKGPAFPEWLKLDPSSGLLSGTPTVDGSFKVNLLVTDSLGYSLTKSAALKVYKSLAISTASLPSDDIGVKYKSTTLKATGGKTPYTWSIVAGELPSGLSFTSKGLISGTPDNQTSGAYPLTIQVSDGITAVTRELAISINPPLAIGALPAGTLGTAYSLDLNTLTGGGSGGYKFAKAGTWPSWLKLDTKGIISGTPPTAGIYTFDLKVSDSFKGTLTQTLTLTIK
jgi:hypothetical protein